MQKIFIVLLLLIVTNCNAQLIEKYYDYAWKECKPNEARFYSIITKTDSGYTRNDYFIHEKSLQMSGKYSDKDCKIADGTFTYFHSNGWLQSTGRYLNNKKEGLWLGYHNNKMMRDSAVYHLDEIVGTSLSWYPNSFPSDSTTVNEDGSYIKVTWFDDGTPSSAGMLNAKKKQNGKWRYFHKNGNSSAIETYLDGNLIEKEYFDENGKLSDLTKSRDAMFPGGDNAWLKYLSKKVTFPSDYEIINGDKAVVVVSFTVSEDGSIENVFVSTPFYPAFDKIAENVIKNSPKWLPAIDHNRSVQSYFRQPVTFLQTIE